MAFSEEVKEEVKKKAAFRCCRCQSIGVEVHHIIPEERWIFKDIKRPEFEKVHPFVSLAEAGKLYDSKEQPLRELVKVKKRSGEQKNLLEEKSSVLHYMSRLKPRFYRIYVLGIDDVKASKIRDKIEKWLRQ